MASQDLLNIVESVAKRRGYRCERVTGRLRIRHPEAPLYLDVVVKGAVVLVTLCHEGIRDFIEDLLDSGEDARDVVESALDDLSGLALEISEALQSRGVKTELRLRDAAMDVLEVLEELEEA